MDFVEQKNRNKPIAITDIAISKVRKTEFEGFSKEQELFIQACHKKLLKTAQKLNAEKNSNEMEAAILIDLYTWNFHVIKGNRPRHVNITDGNIAAKTLFITAGTNRLMYLHNHPSTGTFSGQDFKFFCMNNQIFIMTAIGNDGKIYVLRKTPNFNIEILNKYNTLAEEYYKNGHHTDNGTKAIKEILKQVQAYGIEYKKGSHR